MKADKKPEYVVSALVSTYNSEDLIEGCLADLESQTIADRVEIIVINSGSQQDEKSVVERSQASHDNIVYLETERESLYAAWNRGIRIASGRYVINANTDDRHREDSFEILSRSLDNDTTVDLCYGNWLTTGKTNETYAQNSGDPNMILMYPDYIEPLCMLYFMFSPSPMWRREVVEEVGYFNPDLRSAGDLEWNIRFALAGKKARHIGEALGLFYWDPGSLSQMSDAARTEPEEIFARFRTKDNVLKLYENAGISAAHSSQRRGICNDMARRARGFAAPWGWSGLLNHPSFADACDSWAREET